jgi:hypothetical protein
MREIICTTCGGANCPFDKLRAGFRRGKRTKVLTCPLTGRQKYAPRAAEKPYVMDEIGGKRPSATKADIHSVGFLRGLKPLPLSELSFSAVCKVMPFQSSEFFRSL